MDSARVKDPCRCCCRALVLSIRLVAQGAAVGRRSGILKVIGLAGRYGHRGCGQFVDGCGAGCCEAPLSLLSPFLQEIAGSRYQKVRKNRPRDANILSPILQLIRKEERFVTTYGYLKVLKNT